MLTIMIESLRTMLLQVNSLTILFKTNIYPIYIHLYNQFKNTVQQS